MSGRKRPPSPKVHSISCTDAEWERVRRLADRQGMSISRYFVERGLTVELQEEPEAPPCLVLDEREQRELVARIARISERTVSAESEKGGVDAYPQQPCAPRRARDAGHGARGPGVRTADAPRGACRRGFGGGDYRMESCAHEEWPTKLMTPPGHLVRERGRAARRPTGGASIREPG